MLCKICGLELNADHDKLHSHFVDVTYRCGYKYTYEECEVIKRQCREILNDTTTNIEIRVDAATQILNVLYFRYVLGFKDVHKALNRKDYFASMLYQETFKRSFGKDVHSLLVAKYGTKPGFAEGRTTV